MAKPALNYRRTGRGRPRQEGGERYKSGDLKPPGPNERTIKIRKALLVGDDGRNWTVVGQSLVSADSAGKIERVPLAAAENPLDFMLQRGWITEAEHRTARRYAALYRRIMVSMPGMAVSRQEEACERSGVNKTDFTDMTDKERAAVWDAAFSAEGGRQASQEELEDQAGQLRAIWDLLQGDEAPQLFQVCVLGSWPQWCVWRSTGKATPEFWDRKRRDLFAGLRIAGGVFQTVDRHVPDPAPPTPQPIANDRPLGPKRSERFEYVDPTGALIMEVVRVSRRSAAEVWGKLDH